MYLFALLRMLWVLQKDSPRIPRVLASSDCVKPNGHFRNLYLPHATTPPPTHTMRATLLLAFVCSIAHAQVVPGKVLPTFPQSWDIRKSSAWMTCNATGPVNPTIAKSWTLTDLDWNGGKNVWSATKPMSAGMCLSRVFA